MKLYQRDPIFRAWRVAAIYRCVLTRGMSRSWALGRIREIYPDGSRDEVIRNWFTDIDSIRSYLDRRDAPEEQAFIPRLAA